MFVAFLTPGPTVALAGAGVAGMNTGDPKGIRSGLHGPGRSTHHVGGP